MIINDADPDYRSDKSGLIGLKSANINMDGSGDPTYNFLNQLVKNNVISRPIFSFWVNLDSNKIGHLQIGGFRKDAWLDSSFVELTTGVDLSIKASNFKIGKK